MWGSKQETRNPPNLGVGYHLINHYSGDFLFVVYNY